MLSLVLKFIKFPQKRRKKRSHVSVNKADIVKHLINASSDCKSIIKGQTPVQLLDRWRLHFTLQKPFALHFHFYSMMLIEYINNKKIN